MSSLTKQFLLGRPLRTSQMSERLLPKRLALPVFCSDPLSSVAYATEEILLVLALGGVALLGEARYVAAAIVALLIVVVASYRGPGPARRRATTRSCWSPGSTPRRCGPSGTRGRSTRRPSRR